MLKRWAILEWAELCLGRWSYARGGGGNMLGHGYSGAKGQAGWAGPCRKEAEPCWGHGYAQEAGLYPTGPGYSIEKGHAGVGAAMLGEDRATLGDGYAKEEGL